MSEKEDNPSNRLKEPSTYAGLAVAILAVVFGAGHELASPEFGGAVAVVIAALAAVFLKEKGKSDGQ